MKVERWQKIKELYESALEYAPEKRASFLDENCNGDAELRREVEALLSFSEASTSFMERPAIAEVADVILNQKEKFLAGEKLGHYKIIKPLGAGGMGKVYLAQDTRLGRKIAVKFLAEEFSGDNDRLRRFVLEAKSASALNHPNIITIYEIGDAGGANFIAMEYVEGDSLRHLVGKRKIKLNEAVDAAIQTASALTAAHAAGIIHRDIKPENIMRRPDGLVKILDFGLAKQTSFPHDTDETDTEALARDKIVTEPGTVMGTPAYLSPEQIRGKTADARTDIWSLGVVLYEMITGRVPFTGETNSDMLAGILKSEPEPLSLYAGDVPARLEHIVKKALGKERGERYQSAKDLFLDLKLLDRELDADAQKTGSASSSTTGKEAAPPAREAGKAEIFSPNQRWLWFLAPALVLLSVSALWYFTRQTRQAETNFLASLTSSQIASWKSELSQVDAIRARFSPPDGKLIAYVASKNGGNAIWLKQIDGGEPFTRRPDNASETSPLWSPDGSQIAYISERGGRRGIWTAPALGGAPALVAPLETKSQVLVHWSKDGSTVYFEMRQNLYALEIASKQIAKLTNFDESRPMERGFSFSPDEKRIVYADRKDGQKDLWIADRDGANPARLTDDAAEDSEPVWHKDGERVIYNSNRNGIKQICLAFLDGRPPVQLTFSDSDSKVSDVSADGAKILYASAKDESDLWGVRLDSGKEFQLTSDIGVEFWQDAAPNGETIAYQAARHSSVGDKLFHCLILSQKITGDMSQTQMAEDGFNPRWSPDGSQMAFLRSTAGNNSLWITSAAGGDARVLTGGGIVFGGYLLLPYNRVQTQDYQWSADSRSLIYCAMRDGISNVWQATTDGAGEKQLTSNEDKSLFFLNPLVSPDGARVAWLAMSTLDPRKPAWSVWLQAGDGKASQIYQSESVLSPVGWSASGKELIIKSVTGASGASPFPVEVSLLQIAEGANAPHEIARLKATYFQNIVLSPDRKTIAFVTRADGGDTIQILPSTGGAAKTLADSSGDVRVYFSSLSFAPDGKTIYYGKQANWQIISMINNFK
ncbi:MAG TPA: protein kinase [Pyrinomonadaceae bacterium]|jgi:serine/threonine protein kinase/WD40 repeat protein